MLLCISVYIQSHVTCTYKHFDLSFEEHLYDPVATNDEDDDDEEEPPYEDLGDPSYEDINGVYDVPDDDDDPYTLVIL